MGSPGEEKDLDKTLSPLTGLRMTNLARGPLCWTQGPTKPLLSRNWCTGPKPHANCMLQGRVAPDRIQRGEGRPCGVTGHWGEQEVTVGAREAQQM